MTEDQKLSVYRRYDFINMKVTERIMPPMSPIQTPLLDLLKKKSLKG